MKKSIQRRTQKTGGEISVPARTSHVQQHAGAPRMADSIAQSPYMQAQRAIGESIQNSPQTVAQRRFLAPLAASGNGPGQTLGSNSTALQAMPVALGGVAQLTTAIKHTTDYVTVDPDKNNTFLSSQGNYLVGKAMEAKLDVTDPVVGSATGTNLTWMQALRANYPKAGVVRGHLLNHDLGGFGVPENLYPISTEANADHSEQVEQKVKDLLNKVDLLNQEQEKKGKKADNPNVIYNVKVVETNAHNPGVAEFQCEFGVEGKKLSSPIKVKSDLGNQTGGFRGSGGVKAHKDWFHKERKGAENAKDYLDKGKISLDDSNTKNLKLTNPVEGKYSSIPKEAEKLMKESGPSTTRQAIVKVCKENDISPGEIDNKFVEIIFWLAVQEDEFQETPTLTVLEDLARNFTLISLGLA